jgi:hypothetical protein
MADFVINLSPATKTVGGEGSLDNSIVNGNSIQRSMYLEVVDSTGKRKVLSLKDGDTFSDSTFKTVIDVLPVTAA